MPNCEEISSYLSVCLLSMINIAPLTKINILVSDLIKAFEVPVLSLVLNIGWQHLCLHKHKSWVSCRLVMNSIKWNRLKCLRIISGDPTVHLQARNRVPLGGHTAIVSFLYFALYRAKLITITIDRSSLVLIANKNKIISLHKFRTRFIVAVGYTNDLYQQFMRVQYQLNFA